MPKWPQVAAQQKQRAFMKMLSGKQQQEET